MAQKNKRYICWVFFFWEGTLFSFLKPHTSGRTTDSRTPALFLHFLSSSPSLNSSLQFFRSPAARSSALDQCSKLLGYSVQSLHRKRFEEGAEQFRIDVAQNPNDTEESIWCFLYESQLYEFKEAREQFLEQLATALLIHFGRRMGYRRSRGLEMSTTKKLLPCSNTTI